MFKKKGLICFMIFCLIMTTGCWDRVEIERNAFILGIAIDLNENDEFITTFQIAILESFKGDSGGDSEATQQISISSDNIVKAINELLKHTNSIPNLTHCKLIIFGEEYAKQGIRDSLDFFFRDPDIRRLTSVCVSQGQGKKVLDCKLKSSKSSAISIDQIITENSKSNSEIYGFQDVGYLHQNFIMNLPLVLAKVSANEGEIDVSGAGVFDDYKLVGWYSGEDVTGLRFITGDIKRGILRGKLTSDKGGEIFLNAYNINSSTVPHLKDGNISLKTTINVEGDILDIENPAPIQNPEKVIEDWKKALGDDIHSIVDSVFKKGREIYGVDSFEIDLKMESYYPKFWEQNKNHWEEIFKTIELEVEVIVKIRRVGAIEP